MSQASHLKFEVLDPRTTARLFVSNRLHLFLELVQVLLERLGHFAARHAECLDVAYQHSNVGLDLGDPLCGDTVAPFRFQLPNVAPRGYERRQKNKERGDVERERKTDTVGWLRRRLEVVAAHCLILKSGGGSGGRDDVESSATAGSAPDLIRPRRRTCASICVPSMTST